MNQVAHMEVMIVEHLPRIERIGICLQRVPLGVVGEVTIIGIAVKVKPVAKSLFNGLVNVVSNCRFANKLGDLRELH